MDWSSLLKPNGESECVSNEHDNRASAFSVPASDSDVLSMLLLSVVLLDNAVNTVMIGLSKTATLL